MEQEKTVNLLEDNIIALHMRCPSICDMKLQLKDVLVTDSAFQAIKHRHSNMSFPMLLTLGYPELFYSESSVSNQT